MYPLAGILGIDNLIDKLGQPDKNNWSFFSAPYQSPLRINWGIKISFKFKNC